MNKSINNLLYKLNKFQWENYMEDKHHDLNLICNEIYDYLSHLGCSSDLSKSELRRLVEYEPSVSTLRNKIDDSYNNGFKDDIKEDVLSLMEVRNKVSKKLGFKDYIDLVMCCEDLDFEILKSLIDDYIEKNLNHAKELINKYDLTWGNWFLNLKNIGPIDLKDIDSLIDKFLEKFGFKEVLSKIKIAYDKDMGYSTKISPDDIMICARKPNSIFDLGTLFHELGHGILYYYASEEDDDSFFNITTSFDEFFAVLMENLALLTMFPRDVSEKMKDIVDLEYMRTAISASFEFDLWNFNEDPEKLYAEHYSKLGIKQDNLRPWYKDSFRSLDSMYIHNYTLGQITAEKIIYKNYNNDCLEFGSYLKNICR
ncbi:MAG: M3 family metallopeptidase [Oscillospiraceae bacterium]|nr:M3 family metallopeptidase [Oscillospiraceae bacterium]